MHFLHPNSAINELNFNKSFYIHPDKFDNDNSDRHSVCSGAEKEDTEFDKNDVSCISGWRSQHHTPKLARRLVGETINWAADLRMPEATVAITDSGNPAMCTDTDDHECTKETCQRVIINVSGMHFETQLKTLNRLPCTLLGDPKKRQKYWDERRQEFFFDRHRPTFQAVLYYYQSGGRLKRPVEVPPDVFLDELTFYELGGAVMDKYKKNEGHLGLNERGNSNSGWRKLVWDTLETPGSSWLARIVVIASVFVIVVSVVCFCLETLPEWEHLNCISVSDIEVSPIISTTRVSGAPVSVTESTTYSRADMHNASLNAHLRSNASDDGSIHKPETGYRLRPNYANPFFIIECCCIGWFTVEYVLGMLACSSRIKFLKNLMNLIDLLAIVPFFVTLVVTLATDKCLGKGSGAISILRVVRVLRIFKLGKHSQGLQILGKTLSTSVRDLTMFLLFLMVAIIIFSSAMYFAEHHTNSTHFTSIPDTFWYSLVTITTVGYGEVYPISIPGKMIGSLCVLAGVLTIALPVPILVTNFNTYYAHATGRAR